MVRCARLPCVRRAGHGALKVCRSQRLAMPCLGAGQARGARWGRGRARRIKWRLIAHSIPPFPSVRTHESSHCKEKTESSLQPAPEKRGKSWAGAETCVQGADWAASQGRLVAWRPSAHSPPSPRAPWRGVCVRVGRGGSLEAGTGRGACPPPLKCPSQRMRG